MYRDHSFDIQGCSELNKRRKKKVLLLIYLGRWPSEKCWQAENGLKLQKVQNHWFNKCKGYNQKKQKKTRLRLKGYLLLRYSSSSRHSVSPIVDGFRGWHMCSQHTLPHCWDLCHTILSYQQQQFNMMLMLAVLISYMPEYFMLLNLRTSCYSWCYVSDLHPSLTEPLNWGSVSRVAWGRHGCGTAVHGLFLTLAAGQTSVGHSNAC